MQKFKIRCSKIGDIMGNPRDKKDILPATCITYLKQWVKEQEEMYNVQKQITSKYFEKGIDKEGESIKMLSEIHGIMLIKNEQKFEDKWMTGTPDVLTNKKGFEIKNNWDPFTFPLFELKPDKDNVWQCHGYMALTGLNDFELAYTLNNTPENLIFAEARKYCYKIGLDDVPVEIYDEFKAKMTYDHLPLKLRYKPWDIKRDDEAIAAIRTRVVLCREYIDEYLTINL
jgi:hypothetical protein